MLVNNVSMCNICRICWYIFIVRTYKANMCNVLQVCECIFQICNCIGNIFQVCALVLSNIMRKKTLLKWYTFKVCLNILQRYLILQRCATYSKYCTTYSDIYKNNRSSIQGGVCLCGTILQRCSDILPVCCHIPSVW